MRTRILYQAPSSVITSPLSRSRVSNLLGQFLRQAVCKYPDSARTYATSSVRSKHLPWHDTNIRDFRNVRDASLNRLYMLDARRRKSGRTQKEKQKQTSESLPPVLGDDPPLYDKNPGIFGRWAYFLLAFDILFTGLSVDMVMRNWKQVVETDSEEGSETPSPDSSQSTTSTPPPSPPSNPEDRFELRPLWQRLGLAGVEISLGVAAGALILASRDRTVWRLRVQRVPISSLPPRRPGMRPPPTSSSPSQMINVLAIETGSGRKKRFLMRDCILAPGRDLSELLVSITDIHARYMLSMNGARVLGHTITDVSDSAVLKELAMSKTAEGGISSINVGPGAEDPDNVDICDLRKALAHGWTKAGGFLKVPKVPVESGSWTSGPVTNR